MKHRRRQAFDDEIAGFGQDFSGKNRNARTDRREVAPRLLDVAPRNGSENETGDTGLDPAPDFKPDSAKPRNSYLERLPRHVPSYPFSRPRGPIHSVSMRQPVAMQPVSKRRGRRHSHAAEGIYDQRQSQHIHDPS